MRFSLLTFIFLLMAFKTSTKPPELPPHFLAIDVPMQDFQNAILVWMHTPAGEKEKGHFTVKMPILDLYDRQGALLYQGSQVQANVAFLGRIDAMLHSKSPTVAATGPTLSDYLNELPQLQQHQADIQHPHLPILLAITFPSKPFCEPQNKALKQLENSDFASKLEIIEVRLH